MTPRVRGILESAAAALGSAESARLFDEIVPADFDLPARLQNLRRGDGWQEEEDWTTPWFRASLFLMPAGGTMPLHDHPGMTGLLKVLWGSVRCRSYAWAEGLPGLARATSDRILSPGDGPRRVAPREDNLHRLDAMEDSAFLDLLTPDYSEAEGRPCVYYSEAGTVAVEGGALLRLTPA